MTVLDDSKQVQPASWKEFIGQSTLKERLSVQIEAAKARDERLGHTLLYAEPGTGKTTLAELIAARLETYFTPFLMPIPSNELLRILTYADGVLFLDEIHRLPARVQEDLLVPMEQGVVPRSYGAQPMQGKKLTIIGATTERRKLIRPLLDRFDLEPPWEPYTNDEMSLIVKQMATKLGVAIGIEAAVVLGRASAGSPRQARRLVKAARDCGSDDPAQILHLAGLSIDGLSAWHFNYLNCLFMNSSGFAGLNVLKSFLQMNEDSILELEQTLLRLEFIEYTPKGRTLKPYGYTALMNYQKEVA